jgi:hypothetical protein
MQHPLVTLFGNTSSNVAAVAGAVLQAVAFAAQQLSDPAEQEQQQQQEDPFLLGSCRGELLLLTLQDIEAAGGPLLAGFPPGMQQQWEQAGMLSALTVLQQLQQAGYKLQHGVGVLAEQQKQQQEEEEGVWQLPAAKVDLSFVLEGGSSEEQRQVAVVVSGGWGRVGRGGGEADGVYVVVSTAGSLLIPPRGPSPSVCVMFQSRFGDVHSMRPSLLEPGICRSQAVFFVDCLSNEEQRVCVAGTCIVPHSVFLLYRPAAAAAPAIFVLRTTVAV